jgi:capsular exopolysaccharide synthesis family protein
VEDGSRDDSVDLRFYLGVLRRRGWVIIASTVLVAATAAGLSLLQTKEYQATADVLIGSQVSDQVFTQNGQIDQARNVQTEVKVLKSQTISDAAAKKLRHTPSVSISSDDTSNVVSVVASSDVPTRAAADADAYAKAYVDYKLNSTVDSLVAAGQEVQSKINDIDAELAYIGPLASQRSALEAQRSYLVEQLGRLQVSANLADAGGASVLAKAEVPSSPVSPKPIRNGLIGAVLGFLLGVGLAFLLEHFDDTVQDRDGLEHALSGASPVLAEIPKFELPKKPKSDAHLVVADQPNSIAAEAFRMLRTSVMFLGIDKPLHTIQVTSALEGEGKSTVAANLAVAIAQTGKRAILVDLDLRRPKVHQFFGVSNRFGLTSIMLGESTISAATQRIEGIDQLAVLPSGEVPPNPSELLASPRLAEILKLLVGVVDVVIVDSAPVLPVADSLTIAGMVDGTMLVTMAGESSRRAVHRAFEVLQQVDARIIGTVLNRVDLEAAGYGYSRYHYVDRSRPRAARTVAAPPSGNGRPPNGAKEPAIDSAPLPRS